MQKKKMFIIIIKEAENNGVTNIKLNLEILSIIDKNSKKINKEIDQQKGLEEKDREKDLGVIAKIEMIMIKIKIIQCNKKDFILQREDSQAL